MSLANSLQDVTSIEIEPPAQLSDSQSSGTRVVIDSAHTIEQIVSTIEFKISGKEAIEGCKMPPGFTVRFITGDGSYEADVIITGHQHLVVKGRDEDEETVHYELPPRFEKVIRPYLMESLGLG
jgi:hypothetical protein